MPRQQGITPNKVKAALLMRAGQFEPAMENSIEKYGSMFSNAKALKTSNYSSATLGIPG